MVFQVWHDNEPRFRGTFADVKRWRMGQDGYTQVATVDAETLDDVFERTNHIDQPWETNPGVTLLGGRARSTSVGDVVVDQDGQAWLCASAGWERI
jgi:hypothetical protein